ncbi:MAG TPA: hypothetical protein PLL98_10740 [Bacillota bacterium]|nr:hypothetical protein [Bacillota bacterium]HPL54722.1 hypothetical protein [Bacillota bacterium]
MEDKAFELIEKLYGEFADFRKETRERFDGIDNRFDGIDNRFEGIDNRLDGIDRRLAFIEQDHGKKLQALFDGYTQHSDQLDRIEEKVSRHEDIIIRKVK